MVAPVLVAPAALGGPLRSPVVAAAIGRGLERAGAGPPELCPVSSGGAGTIEVLLPVLGGETGDGFALVDDGVAALVELGAGAPESARRLASAVAAGVQVVVLCAGDRRAAAAALRRAGGLGDVTTVVLCERLAASAEDPADALLGATPVAGPAFVLEQIGFDARMRAARAVVVGEARLDHRTLRGGVAGEIAYRARQAGVPCHAVTARHAVDRFDARILDVQAIVEARTIAELEAAGERLAGAL